MLLPVYYFNATPKIKNSKDWILAAHFAKRNTKFGGGGKTGGAGISFPPNLLSSPPRPSVQISKFAVRIFVKKSLDFNQKAPPVGKM